MPDNLKFMVRKLRTRADLSAQAEAAILSLTYVRRTYEPHAYLVREGALNLTHCSFVLSGYAFRQKLTLDGARQIVSLHMRGDLLDLQHLFLKRTDHNVQALTRVEVLNIDRIALRDLALAEPEVGQAMWIDALIDASVFREWVVNVGRRDAKARVAHLLCEFALRMKLAGLGDGESCDLPMTQEQLADAVSLTSVHVNRTLKALEADGLIQRSKRQVSFNNWNAISAAADFNALYLHLDQTEELQN